jgi:hypothetical protein
MVSGHVRGVLPVFPCVTRALRSILTRLLSLITTFNSLKRTVFQSPPIQNSNYSLSLLKRRHSLSTSEFGSY